MEGINLCTRAPGNKYSTATQEGSTSVDEPNRYTLGGREGENRTRKLKRKQSNKTESQESDNSTQ